MKILSIIAITFYGSALASPTRRSVNLARAARGQRSTRSTGFKGALGGVMTSISHTMKRTVMQDESTFYDIILSGADTLPEVNALLTKRDPHFDPLKQDELDSLIDQWLFQMLAK